MRSKPNGATTPAASSHDVGAAQFNLQARQHWSIENGCRGTLDVIFREDKCRVRVGHGAENFAIIRRMTLNLIKSKRKKSNRNLAA